MGIKFDKIINHITKDEYHNLDYEIMGLAFRVHKELGKFWNENIYQYYFAKVCKECGFNVDIEVPIIISFNNFIKRYYIDILINNSIIYELKATDSLISKHKNQTLNYLLLTDCNYGKLINFSGVSVNAEYVTSSLTKKERYDFCLIIDKWIDVDNDSKWLKELIISLLQDCGAFISFQFFYDAIYFFRGGKENVVRSVKIKLDKSFAGTQKINLLNNKTAFDLSCITKTESKKFYKKSLERFLSHSHLESIQWINFNNHNIEFETLRNK